MLAVMSNGVMENERVTVNLPASDLRFLKHYEATHSLSSRSATVRAAIAALREKELVNQYVEADQEWHASADAALWEGTASDGLAGA